MAAVEMMWNLSHGTTSGWDFLNNLGIYPTYNSVIDAIRSRSENRFDWVMDQVEQFNRRCGGVPSGWPAGPAQPEP